METRLSRRTPFQDDRPAVAETPACPSPETSPNGVVAGALRGSAPRLFFSGTIWDFSIVWGMIVLRWFESWFSHA